MPVIFIFPIETSHCSTPSSLHQEKQRAEISKAAYKESLCMYPLIITNIVVYLTKYLGTMKNHPIN